MKENTEIIDVSIISAFFLKVLYTIRALLTCEMEYLVLTYVVVYITLGHVRNILFVLPFSKDLQQCILSFLRL